RLFEKWRDGSRYIDESLVAFINAAGLSHRTMIFDTLSSDGRLVHSFIGQGYQEVYGAEWVTGAIGKPIEWQPDAAFGNFVADVYNGIVRSGNPQFVHMAHQIPGTGEHRFYERIACPFKTSGGAPVVVCCSRIVEPTF
ncbi:unnamed protein product, partial [Chrysoparadoxa australica]